MSNSSFAIDSVLHNNLDLDKTGETVQRLFDDAYKMSENTALEIGRQAKPVCDYVSKRVEENPQEAAIEGLGAVACLGLGAAAIATSGPFVVGGLMYGSVLAGGSVVTYETFKQLREHGILGK